MSRLVRRLSFGFAAVISVLFVAFNVVTFYAPQWLSEPMMPPKLLSRGMVIGLALIVLATLATGLFVWIVNSRFDRLLDETARRLSREPRP